VNREDVSGGSDIQTVPIGLVMAVQPAIDPVNKSVILFLRPTISRLVDSVTDPSVALAGQRTGDSNIKIPESKVPVIEVKEIDSVLRLKNDEVAILGGLMETQSANKQSKTPIIGEVPIIQEAFSSTEKNDTVTEIVILIRVKILDFIPPDQADERLVHLYTNDPRPIC
jgi:general secretion pathway protein D